MLTKKYQISKDDQNRNTIYLVRKRVGHHRTIAFGDQGSRFQELEHLALSSRRNFDTTDGF